MDIKITNKLTFFMRYPIKLILYIITIIFTSSFIGVNAQEFIEQAPPIYPEELRLSALEGKVVIQFSVNNNGVVKDVRVIESSHPLFSKEAIRTAKKWKMKPFKMPNGKDVAWFQQEVNFKLEHNENSNDINKEEFISLFKDKLDQCISMGFLKCDAEFIGRNRGEFHVLIEHEKLKKTQSESLVFFELNYPKSCKEANELLSIDMTGDINISKNKEKIFSYNEFNINQRNDGVIVYKHESFPYTYALVPDENGYKIGVDISAEDSFKKTDAYAVYVYMRVKNNINNFHIEDAKYNKRTCSEYVKKINEALAPIILSSDKYKDNELGIIARKYVVRNLDEITNYYYNLNSKENIYKRIYEESSTCMQHIKDGNYKNALAPCEEESQAGNYVSQYGLGFLYYSDESGMQNFEKAFTWLEKSAEQGDVDAQFLLGNLYYKGLGVKQSFSDTVKWYSKAAFQGDTVAAYNLAVMSLNGDGIKQNLKMAYALAISIINKLPNDKGALEIISLVKEHMTEKQIEEAEILALQLTRGSI